MNQPTKDSTNGVPLRRKRSRKVNLEKIFVFVVVTTAIIAIGTNMTLMTTLTMNHSDDHHSVSNTNTKSKSHSLVHHISAAQHDNDKSSNSNNAKKPMEQLQAGVVRANSDADQGSTSSNNELVKEEGVYTVDERLMRILRHVGIHNATQLTEEDRRLLPSWDEVVERVGSEGPKILGLDTCKAYAANVPKDKRRLAVAGPFNSGTHYLDEVLRENCKWIPKGAGKGPGVLNQVPWGKHQSPRFRKVHSVVMDHSLKNDNDKEKEKNGGQLKHPQLPEDILEKNLNVLPVVMVRDPFTWWQSMCRARYSAHWYHIVEEHCPNFVANEVERKWFNVTKAEIRKHYKGDPDSPWKIDNVDEKANYTLDKKIVPLWVRYHSENRKHKSLAHMWIDWYKDYEDVDYPRLMVRLEDLVFYPHETLRQICECGNGGSGTTPSDDGWYEYIGDENLVLSLESSIKGQGNIHGHDRVGLLGAMAKHAGAFSVSHRAKGMTKEDLEFATEVLKDSETMSFFGYKIPHETHLNPR